MKRSLALLLVPLGLATAAHGQAPPVGTLTWAIHVTLPPGTAGALPFAQLPDMQMQVGGDGRRVMLGFSVTGAGTDPMSQMMGTAWFRMVSRPAGDSVDFAVAVPAALRAMLDPNAGAMAPEGYRLALPFIRIDTFKQFKFDSLMDAMHKLPMVPDTSKLKPHYAATGTHRTLAGLDCEDWAFTVDTVSVRLCLAQDVPFANALSDYMIAKLGMGTLVDSLRAFAERNPGMPDAMKSRHMLPLRFATADSQVVMQIVEASSTPPPASAFDIPASFKVVDPKALKAGAMGKLGGSGLLQP